MQKSGQDTYKPRYLAEVGYRGKIDMNFIRADGSGFTVSDVEMRDPRLKPVPARTYNQSTAPNGRWMLLPAIDFSE